MLAHDEGGEAARGRGRREGHSLGGFFFLHHSPGHSPCTSRDLVMCRGGAVERGAVESVLVLASDERGDTARMHGGREGRS